MPAYNYVKYDYCHKCHPIRKYPKEWELKVCPGCGRRLKKKAAFRYNIYNTAQFHVMGTEQERRPRVQ